MVLARQEWQEWKMVHDEPSLCRSEVDASCPGSVLFFVLRLFRDICFVDVSPSPLSFPLVSIQPL
jgi:hypothetical protein